MWCLLKGLNSHLHYHLRSCRTCLRYVIHRKRNIIEQAKKHQLLAQTFQLKNFVLVMFIAWFDHSMPSWAREYDEQTNKKKLYAITLSVELGLAFSAAGLHPPLVRYESRPSRAMRRRFESVRRGNQQKKSYHAMRLGSECLKIRRIWGRN